MLGRQSKSSLCVVQGLIKIRETKESIPKTERKRSDVTRETTGQLGAHRNRKLSGDNRGTHLPSYEAEEEERKTLHRVKQGCSDSKEIGSRP